MICKNQLDKLNDSRNGPWPEPVGKVGAEDILELVNKMQPQDRVTDYMLTTLQSYIYEAVSGHLFFLFFFPKS